MKSANNAPIYACVYKGFAEIARAYGYALAVHGTLARDFDVIAIPWIEDAKAPEDLVKAITDKYAVRLLKDDENPTLKPHGRLAYSLHFAFGDVYLDLQFMPRLPA